MAGINKILKPNTPLFNAGDAADAMYIVRKGTLKVFFLKGQEEVTLATIKDGGIVGEMAFFDEKPRSASVKAIDSCEVTVISKADFEKLLQQVPKWMVTMMQSLVARLRQTNERLQTIEASQTKANASGVQAGALILANQRHPFQHVLRGMQLMMLALAKDGEKDNRDLFLQREIATKLWNDFSGEAAEIFNNTLAQLEKIKMVTLKTDARKIQVISFPNRGQLVNFLEFFSKIAKQLKPLQPFLSNDAMDLFTAMVDQVASSGYESLNVGVKSLIAAQIARGKDASGWGKALTELNILPDVKIQKNSDDITCKINVKEHKLVLLYLKHMQTFKDAGLA